MSNPYLPLVNQKLAHARQLQLLLDASAESLQIKQKNAAICDAICLQLGSAYRSFLRELASHYRVSLPQEVSSASRLQLALERLSVNSPEALEWARLEAGENEANPWLSELLYAASVSLDPAIITSASQVAGVQLINTVEEGPTKPQQATVELVTEWLSSLTAVINRQREGLQEL